MITVQAYAKLQFRDGTFLVDTHAVILGRDQSDEIDGQTCTEEPQQKRPKKGPRCVLSEQGGCMGVDIPDAVKQNERIYQLSRQPAPVDREPFTDDIDINTCPVIPIHEPAYLPDFGPGKRFAISRRHALIGWDFDAQHWICVCLGTNGMWCDGQYLAPDGQFTLHNGTHLQIGSVECHFYLPNPPQAESGSEDEEVSDEDSGETGSEVEDDGSMSPGEANNGGGDVEEEQEEDEEEQEESEEEDEIAATAKPRQYTKRGRIVKPKILTSVEPEVKPKRRPGRPPKNGKMSQREMAERRREEKGVLKAQGQKPGQLTKVVKSKPSPSNLQPNGKRKYTKRKTADEAVTTSVHPSIESGESDAAGGAPEVAAAAAKVPKEKKPAKELKPPKSPSPKYNWDELTEEQKSKPVVGYVTILYDILSAGPPMNLTQIYHAMMRKYPYYTVQTSDGWRSSVRHNLGQNHCFMKAEKDGKGHKWKINPDVPFEREKKTRRASPPRPKAPSQHPQQHIPPYGPHMGYPHHFGYGASNGHPPYPVYNGGTPQPQGRPSLPFPSRFPPSMLPPPLNPLRQNGESTYMSPYASQNQPATSTSAQQPHLQATSGYPSLPPMGPPINGIQRPPVSPQPPQQQPSSPQLGSQHAPPPSTQEPLTNIQMTDGIRAALDRFKASLIKSMSTTVPNAESLVDYAIAQTLGKEDKNEDWQKHPMLPQIMVTLRGVFNRLGVAGAGQGTEANTSSPANGTQNGTTDGSGTEDVILPPDKETTEAKSSASLADALDAAKENATSIADARTASTFAITSSLQPQLAPESSTMTDEAIEQAKITPQRPSALTTLEARLASPEVPRHTRSSSKRPHESDDEEAEETGSPSNTNSPTPAAAENSGASFTANIVTTRSRKKRSS